MKRWKADLTPISENEKSRLKKINPVSLGYDENPNNGTRDENSSAQHVFKKNLNYKIRTSPENGQPHPFHPTQLPLPHRINALLASQTPKLSTLPYPKKTFWGNSSPCYTAHLCQPILNQSPKDTPLNFTSLGLRLSSHTSLFWTLPGQLSMLHHAFVPTHPEPKPQRYITKPQTVRFSSHTSVLNFAGTACHVTPRMCANPSWTNVPRHTTNFRSDFFHLTHPCFELCRNNPEQITPRMCANPEPTFQRRTPKPQTPRFSSHTSLFWTLPEQLSILHHACVPALNQGTPQNLRP